jgi:hypothetical protein
MKRIVLLLGLFGLIFFLLPYKVLAGPQCSTKGGSCSTACSISDTPSGPLDCPTQNGGRGAPIQQVCCVPQSSGGGSSGGSTSGSSPVNIQGRCAITAIDTAIGCIPVLNSDNGTAFMGFILRWAVGIGGGIAFLLILYGGFMIMTSSGNPERLKAGQELLTSAIGGIILLIFSVFLLKVIGIDILGLGSYGFGK